MTDIKLLRDTIDTLGKLGKFTPKTLMMLMDSFDEVEALRAQVAAAPVVLREWPKTAAEAPGEWVLVTRGIPISGEFGTADGVVYFVSWNNESIGAGSMDPCEFFVRCP